MSDPTDGHLDLDALADLLAGELAGADLDAATAHLGSCDRCSAALADLDAALVPVAATLAAAPLPPVPPDLEATLLARLAVEPAPTAAPVREVPAGARAAGDDVLPGGAVPLRPRASARRGRGPGVLGVAAGAVGLLAVVGLGLGLARGGSDEGASSSAGGREAAVAAPLDDLPSRATGTDYRPDGDVFARTLPALLAPGTADTQVPPPLAAAEGTTGGATSGGGSAGAAAGSSAGSAPGSAPDTAADTAADGAARASAPDPLQRLRDPAELAGCLAELSGPESDGLPLALDYATYQGQPALVVVLPSAREGKVDVFAVGAGCRAGDDRTLYFTRLDRP